MLPALSLGGNRLTGTIPTQLGNLGKLYRLHLAGNQLTGSIPTQLGSLTALTRLALHTNQLTGSIPTQLGQLNPRRPPQPMPSSCRRSSSMPK